MRGDGVVQRAQIYGEICLSQKPWQRGGLALKTTAIEPTTGCFLTLISRGFITTESQEIPGSSLMNLD